MTLSQGFIIEKITLLEGYTREMSGFLALSDGEIKLSPANMHALERVFQLAVDAMIDVNQHLIRELDLKMADDFQSTFYTIGENRIIPEDFARKIAPIVGVRNRLVHQYEKVDKDMFISNLRKNFSDFGTYKDHISGYISKNLG